MSKLKDLWRVLWGDMTAGEAQAWAEREDMVQKYIQANREANDATAEASRVRALYDYLYRERRETDAQIFRVSQCIDAEDMRRELSKLISAQEQRMQAESKVIGEVAQKMLAERGVVT